MFKPTISLIAAIDENRGIGKNNQLLFHIPDDLKRFKQLTRNHPVIMGRKTYESIGKPLPQRLNIIITRDSNFQIEGCTVSHSLEEAIRIAKQHEKEEIFIIGGGQIYQQAIQFADKLYLTLIKGTYDADAFFPDYSAFGTVNFHDEKQYQQYTYAFLELTR